MAGSAESGAKAVAASRQATAAAAHASEVLRIAMFFPLKLVAKSLICVKKKNIPVTLKINQVIFKVLFFLFVELHAENASATCWRGGVGAAGDTVRAAGIVDGAHGGCSPRSARLVLGPGFFVQGRQRENRDRTGQ